MRISGRSNVVIWLTSKDFGVRSLAAVKPTAFPFCAVRLAMPLARLSDRLDAKNAQIVSHRVLSRPGCSHVVFALYDREEIRPRMLARIDSDSQAGASTCRVEIINS